MDKNSFLSCPFCAGSRLRLEYDEKRYEKYRWCLVCDGCHACSPRAATTELVQTLWNNRAQHAAAVDS